MWAKNVVTLSVVKEFGLRKKFRYRDILKYLLLHLQIIHLTRHLYLEYPKNIYSSITREKTQIKIVQMI